MKKMNEILDGMKLPRAERELSVHRQRGTELEAAAGRQWAERFTVLDYRRGTLVLGVESSALLQEVSQFRAADWLKLLQKNGSPVKKIKTVLIDGGE